MEPKYDLEEYVTDKGKTPFTAWVNGLKDKTAPRKIAQRLQNARLGHFGDYKSITGTKGIYEMRIHYGPGYRVFYSIVQNKIILLLAGSMKRDQNGAIAKARHYLADYERRASHE